MTKTPTECYDSVTHVFYREHEESVHNPGKCGRCGEILDPKLVAELERENANGAAGKAGKKVMAK